jgi:phosphotransacetylase/acyl dehydratase
MTSNRTYDEIAIGDLAQLERAVEANDLFIFASASGNANPLLLPEWDPDGDGASNASAPAMWLAALVSTLLGNTLPGPGTVHESHALRFPAPAPLGARLRVRIEAMEKMPARRVRFAVTIDRQDGVRVAEGEAIVIAPVERIAAREEPLPGLLVERHQHIDRLLLRCEALPALRTAVVAPEDDMSLAGALLARRRGLIEPVLIGEPARIAACAASLGEDINGIELVSAAGHDAAACAAVELVSAGRAQAIMKGRLHSDQLLAPVVRRESGLRTGRRMSHVFVMDVPGHAELMLITDAAINIAPTLEDKVDIVQNAIDLALALGCAQPRVGILSAVEVVNPKIASTLDAAVLSKMAERGQIRGGLVDGPLAMDNALSLSAARAKGIASLVAGRANVLVVPNIESGNMLAKELAFLSHAEGAGVVLGARAPIMLTSRADDDRARLASCAVAVLYEHWRRTGAPAP